MQSVDVHREQSHHLKIDDQDTGSHIDMPQPYNISEINNIYKSVLENLKAANSQTSDTSLTETQANLYDQSLKKLLQMSRIESQFYEVENAAGVIWSLIGDRQKAHSFFKRALLINPDDKLISDNQKLLQNKNHQITVARTEGKGLLIF
jgi:tetratricopeptide (TPR) repeat protein